MAIEKDKRTLNTINIYDLIDNYNRKYSKVCSLNVKIFRNYSPKF